MHRKRGDNTTQLTCALSSRITNFNGLSAAVTVAAAAVLVSRNASATTGKLLVFLHAPVKQRALQIALQAALPSIEVVAVGRLGDFERSLREGVDAVMTLPVVLSAFNLAPRLRGYQAGNADERYSLVAVGVAPDPARVATVGALDLLGREGTNAFVKDLLGTNSRVERVSKLEDLLRLLQAQAADAVLLPSRLMTEMRATSRLDLMPMDLKRRVGLPAAVGISNTGPEVLAALRTMPAQVANTLGVDSWR